MNQQSQRHPVTRDSQPNTADTMTHDLPMRHAHARAAPGTAYTLLGGGARLDPPTVNHGDRGFCQDPAALPPKAQKWATLKTGSGLDGHCRTASGGKGTYATVKHVSDAECASLCARTIACVAYEFSDKCELHTTVPTKVESSPTDIEDSNRLIPFKRVCVSLRNISRNSS